MSPKSPPCYCRCRHCYRALLSAIDSRTTSSPPRIPHPIKPLRVHNNYLINPDDGNLASRFYYKCSLEELRLYKNWLDEIPCDCCFRHTQNRNLVNGRLLNI